MYGEAPTNRALVHAWILLCLALCLHVYDEATTGFLGIYNPTVVALREKIGWWSMPTLTLREFLTVMSVTVVVLLALSVAVRRGAIGTRALAYVFAVIMLLNAGSHTLATIFGRTVASVTFPRPAPGFWSSPVMAAAAVYLLYQLRKSSRHGVSPA